MHTAQEPSAFKQILILLGLMVGGILLQFVLSFLILIPFEENYMAIISTPEKYIGFIKTFQIIQSICLFIVPAYLMARLAGLKAQSYFYFDTRISIKTGFFIILMLWAATPMINLLGFINQQMQLPDSMAGIENWMRASEEQAKVLTQLLTSSQHPRDLAINLIMIAVLPALGEEMLFRGVIQRIMLKSTGRIHLAVWITAIIFSAFHLQFYGFLPRLFLGAFLGYLFIYSGSLWLPILAHFINNATATVFYYLYHNGVVDDTLDTIGTSESWIYGLFSAIIFSLLVFYLKRNKTEFQLNELSQQT